MTQIRWTPQAVEDLEAIHAYVARDSTHYATMLIERLFTAVDRLTTSQNLVGWSQSSSEWTSARSSSVPIASSIGFGRGTP